jgi:hypothetical protein
VVVELTFREVQDAGSASRAREADAGCRARSRQRQRAFYNGLLNYTMLQAGYLPLRGFICATGNCSSLSMNIF